MCCFSKTTHWFGKATHWFRNQCVALVSVGNVLFSDATTNHSLFNIDSRYCMIHPAVFSENIFLKSLFATLFYKYKSDITEGLLFKAFILKLKITKSCYKILIEFIFNPFPNIFPEISDNTTYTQNLYWIVSKFCRYWCFTSHYWKQRVALDFKSNTLFWESNTLSRALFLLAT